MTCFNRDCHAAGKCVAEPGTGCRACPPADKMVIDVFYIADMDPFICAAYGKTTVELLSSMETALIAEKCESARFTKGEGVYRLNASEYPGQYGEFGRCELPPGWEFDDLGFLPLAEESDHPSLTSATPKLTLPDGVTPDDGMDGKYIERRIERWYVEGLHSGDRSACPYVELTHAERWWKRGAGRIEDQRAARKAAQEAPAPGYEKMRGGLPVAHWRDDALEQAAQIAERYGADPRIARDIRVMKSPLPAAPEQQEKPT